MADDADRLAWLLAATAGQLARDTPRQPSTSVAMGQVDLTRALAQLHAWLPTFTQRIVPGDIDEGEWTMLAKILEVFAQECRRQEPPSKLDDPGSGR